MFKIKSGLSNGPLISSVKYQCASGFVGKRSCFQGASKRYKSFSDMLTASSSFRRVFQSRYGKSVSVKPTLGFLRKPSLC